MTLISDVCGDICSAGYRRCCRVGAGANRVRICGTYLITSMLPNSANTLSRRFLLTLTTIVLLTPLIVYLLVLVTINYLLLLLIW